MEKTVIINGLRTPFCKWGTDYNNLTAQELGTIVTRGLIKQLGLDSSIINEVIFGNVTQPYNALNISRIISLYSGIPNTTPAFTVSRNCASGFESIVLADLKIKSGQGNCYLAGGVESMTNIPFLFSKQLQDILLQLSKTKNYIQKLKILRKLKLNFLTPRNGLQLGLIDPVCGLNMGEAADQLGKQFGISREEQDEFSLKSHQKATAAQVLLKEEIMCVKTQGSTEREIVQDNGPRSFQTIESLKKLKPYFNKESGTVTAGNSSQISDGAGVLLVMSEKRAKELGFRPLCYLRAHECIGLAPDQMGLGPAHAIPQVLKKAGMTVKDIDAIEINEAFAVQVISCLQAMRDDSFKKKYGYENFSGKFDLSLLNPNGGSIALGHPLGATGTRLILTMMKHLNRKNLNTGLVSLCVGGGQGMAIILER